MHDENGRSNSTFFVLPTIINEFVVEPNGCSVTLCKTSLVIGIMRFIKLYKYKITQSRPTSIYWELSVITDQFQLMLKNVRRSINQSINQSHLLGTA